MVNSLAYAKQLDEQDHLKDFRQQFHIPVIDGKAAVYFNGNSLGLQPKKTRDYINQELEDWAQLGVEGHVHARNPWMEYHEKFPVILSKILGCLQEEVVVMSQLTVNLHLLMVSFYKPTKTRYKIICEAKAFPSDQYAMQSQVAFHGYDPNDAIIEVTPREGEYIIRNEDILAAIEQHKDSLALVLIGGVNYYTGQVFDMQAITAAAHKAGAYAGFDLAHAAGNIPLHLNEWKVDFACWCSYKYLNSSPGGVAGIYINKDHVNNKELPRFAGWWGHDKGSRFTMGKDFNPTPTAEGWQVSNTMVLLMAAHKASLEIFEEAGFDQLVEKSRRQSDYLFFILDEINKEQDHTIIEIITPRNSKEKGCQVSMLMLQRGKEIFNELKKHGVITDWREPNVIRIAPVPLYNSYEDIWRFGNIIARLLHT